ncbi:MAG: acetyl-CoA carboxylase biotin carboxyl carrier protein subunit [Proteobacteria bacterium]|nr:acetyl-CoA carboxylase biotin carboxyl carrier protein subunit [Pseudomonadota bacterium]MDA1022710.1 acetyl-CoA carboxylase biotin carboxyl carrier protein subunit [Pseudomonadota bacterium]
MSKPPKNQIDEDLIRQLKNLLDETGLTEIEYGRDGWHIRVKGGVEMVAASPHLPASPGPAPAPASDDDDPAAIDLTNAVTSPMVGVVFTGPDPEAPPFIKAGDEVKEGQTLLLIEAMKVFNPITATKSGRVTEILISNGSPVEFGEPLLILE